MLSRQRPAERRSERGDLLEDGGQSIAPPSAADVDERVHVDMRVTSVAEDHATRLVRLENAAHAAHVVSQSLGRNRRVLDELHRTKIWIEPREDWARRVAQLPQLR